jgi:hypothetical protein
MSVEDNTEPTLAWLQARLKLDDKGLSFVIQRQSPLLCLNIDTNLEPTITFYEDCVGSNTARTMISKYPVLLPLSLENRLKPRLEETQEAGIPIDTRTMTRIAMMTEEKWCASMAFQKKKLSKEKNIETTATGELIVTNKRSPATDFVCRPLLPRHQCI